MWLCKRKVLKKWTSSEKSKTMDTQMPAMEKRKRKKKKKIAHVL
jgi:hypothetical protein